MNSASNLSIEHEQTIVALCTPQGAGAIGLIRLSGKDVWSIVDSCARLASGKKLSEQATHTIHYGWVVDQSNQEVDQVLFLVMHAPRTFTGQDVVEITCHNNAFLIEAIIDRILQCGARLAGKGEFTQRAVMLGKIDLLQAEAISDLIHAQTAASLKYSLQQLQGSLSSWTAQIETAVIEMMAYCEGSFEFLDEEMEFAADVASKMDALILKVEKLLQTFPKQQYIKEGIRIALIGSVNAGKSSLFNCLLDKQRAIVTPIAGTTRDTIEAGVFRDGEFITFVDTAGLRSTDDQIEREGIDRSFQEAANADIILLVVDGATTLSDETMAVYRSVAQQYKDKIIFVQNKIDAPSSDDDLGLTLPTVAVSAKNHEKIDLLYQEIFQKIKILKGSDAITCLLNKRQYDLLSKFLQDMLVIAPMVKKRQVDYELVSCRLKDALQLLAEMTGRSVSEAALDKVFQTFCVGK